MKKILNQILISSGQIRPRSWREEDVGDLLHRLDSKDTSDRWILHFIFVVLAIENSKELSLLAQRNCNNLNSDPKLGSQINSARDYLFSHTELSGKAVEHCMEVNSYETISYLVQNLDAIYITPIVKYSYVRKMAINYSNTKDIISVMVKNKVQVRNLESMEEESLDQPLEINSEMKSAESIMTVENRKRLKTVKESINEDSEFAREESKGEEMFTTSFQKASDERTVPQSSRPLITTQLKDLPAPQTTF